MGRKGKDEDAQLSSCRRPSGGRRPARAATSALALDLQTATVDVAALFRSQQKRRLTMVAAQGSRNATRLQKGSTADLTEKQSHPLSSSQNFLPSSNIGFVFSFTPPSQPPLRSSSA